MKSKLFKDIKLHPSWSKILKDEFKKDYFISLQSFLDAEIKKNKVIYPKMDDVFNAFNSTPFNKVKVVIIGQDPYHGEGQAHGLCFSVRPEVTKLPPSLKNIYKEMKTDLGIEPPKHGYLQSWADQGVLMLNNLLTVEKSLPGSHRKKGWEVFTDKVIEVLNEEKESLVFILWGNDAKKKALNVDKKKHHIIESAHPSPFSCRNFYGTKPLSRTNDYLESHSLKPIDWKL